MSSHFSKTLLITASILFSVFGIYSFEFSNTHAELGSGLGLRIRADTETLREGETITFTLDHSIDGAGWNFPSFEHGFIALQKDGIDVTKINFRSGQQDSSIRIPYIPRSAGSWTAQAFECTPSGQTCDAALFSPIEIILYPSNIIYFTVNPVVSGPPSITISVSPTTIDAGAEVNIFSTVNNLPSFSSLLIVWKKGMDGFGTGATTDSFGNISGEHFVPDIIGDWQVWIEYQTNGNKISNVVNVTVREAGSQPSLPLAPTLTFTANPITITAGEPSTLSWLSTNTTSCNATAGGWTTDGAKNGSKIVNPITTTIFNLTCTGPGGSIERSVKVTVESAGGGGDTGSEGSTGDSTGSGGGGTSGDDSTGSGGETGGDSGGGDEGGVFGGLVPCGRSQDDLSTTDRDERNACTTCDIFVLASNVINFILFTVTPAIAMLLFLIAGFMILLGGANPGLVSSGKNIFKTTVYGLLLIFGAWMITNTILKSLAGNYFDGQDDPWNKVVCVGGGGFGGGGFGGGGFGGGGASGGWGEGNCEGATCSDSNLNICGSTPTNCSISSVNQWSAQISATISTAGQICSGVDTAKLIKAIMANESGGVPRTASDGESAGLMQLKPATANNYKTQCGVLAGTVIDFAWLNNSANGQAQICIAIEYIKNKLVGQCGCDVRQLAAGYNGGEQGACNESTNCGSAASAESGQCLACADEIFTRRWECLWDDNEHTICNVDRPSGSLSVTRAYVPKVSYCYGQF